MGDGCAAAVGPIVFADDERKTENDTRQTEKTEKTKTTKKRRRRGSTNTKLNILILVS